jgi:hypothetical protein
MASSVVTRHLQSLAGYLKGLFQSESKARDESNQKWHACMSTKLDSLKDQRIPEYHAAILSCSVTLQQIVEARDKLHSGCHSYEENSLILYEELLWLTYQHAHGTIEEYYFGMGGRAAVVLTNSDSRRKAMNLDLFYPLDELSQLTPNFESTLWTCISQFQSIAELDLNFKGQDAVFLELYLIVIYIFVVVEAQQASHQNRESLDALSVRMPDIPAAPGRVTAKAIEDISSKSIRLEDIPGMRIQEALNRANDHLKKLIHTIDQFSRREAQVVYIRGMFLGIFSVLALVAVYVDVIFRVSATRDWTSDTQLLWHLIAIAVTSGALGAVVSVMLRVSNRPLSISYNAGRSLIWLAGYFRPIVGAIFGLAFYVLINAGFLKVLAAPRDIGSRAFFVAAVCFAAGFSERRAQDFIVRALPTEKGAESDADESPARRPEEGRIS